MREWTYHDKEGNVVQYISGAAYLTTNLPFDWNGKTVKPGGKVYRPYDGIYKFSEDGINYWINGEEVTSFQYFRSTSKLGKTFYS